MDIKPSDGIRKRAEKRWEERIRGRSIGPMEKADLLLGELLNEILEHIDKQAKGG